MKVLNILWKKWPRLIGLGPELSRAAKRRLLWMAYEELPFPTFTLPFGLEKNRDEAIGFTLVSNSINSAFSDFNTGVKFVARYQGQSWSDSQGMTACLKRAMDAGIDVLDGRYLAKITRPELARARS